MNVFAIAYGTQGKGTLIGKDLKTGRSFRLQESHRSMHIIGAPDMGKSNFMLNCILEDIARNDKAIMVLDPHTDLAKAVALKCPPDQADRVTYFGPHTQFKQGNSMLGLNPFQVTDLAVEYEEKVQAIMDVFAHSWYGDYRNAPLMQNTLETLVRTLLKANPSEATSFLHMLLLTELTDGGDLSRRKLAEFVKDNPALAQIFREWDGRDPRRTQLKADIVSSRQKIKHVTSSDILSAILCQPTSAPCFNFRQLIAHKGVLLVGLRGLDREGIRLIGSFILTQLLAIVKLTKEEERLPCHIYADEFHNFSPQSFVEIIDQARKFNLFCTIAHQRLNQLNDETISAVFNCENVVVFRTHPDDAQRLRKHFRTSRGYLSAETISRLKKWDAVVKYSDDRAIGQVGITTFAEKRPENREVAAAIWKRSISQGRSLAEIERYKVEVEQSLVTKNEGKPSSPPASPEADKRQQSKKPPFISPEPDDSDFRHQGKPPSRAVVADSANKAKGPSQENQAI